MSESLVELQSQRDALKENLQDVNKNIKKLTGRDPTDSRRPLTNQRRFQLKRTSLGNSSNNQPPEKRAMAERRRWGSTVVGNAGGGHRNKKKLDSGGEEEDEDVKKPAVHSSVVATGKPIEVPQRPKANDKASVNRNKRMLGVLMGTLKQFKRENQFKSEQESKREEKLIKVEEQVEKEKEDAQIERKELFHTRKTKQEELRKLEFKIDMAELNVELKQHYEHLKEFIQLKSTPRLFYKPAKHNPKTLKLLEESQQQLKESLEQRLKEIEMCTEDEVTAARIANQSNNRRQSRVSKNVTIIEPKQSKRDLFAEDEDEDQREREADTTKDTIDDDKSDDDDVVVIEQQDTTSRKVGKVLNGSVHKVERKEQEVGVTGHEDATVDEEEGKDGVEAMEASGTQDSRRVVSDTTFTTSSSTKVVSDERVVKLGVDDDDEEAVVVDAGVGGAKEDDDIYADMQPDIDQFRADDMEV